MRITPVIVAALFMPMAANVKIYKCAEAATRTATNWRKVQCSGLA